MVHAASALIYLGSLERRFAAKVTEICPNLTTTGHKASAA